MSKVSSTEISSMTSLSSRSLRAEIMRSFSSLSSRRTKKSAVSSARSPRQTSSKSSLLNSAKNAASSFASASLRLFASASKSFALKSLRNSSNMFFFPQPAFPHTACQKVKRGYWGQNCISGRGKTNVPFKSVPGGSALLLLPASICCFRPPFMYFPFSI